MINYDRPQTGKEALQWAASFLIARGFTIQSAQQEGRLLLAKVWQKDFLQLVIGLENSLDDVAWEKYQLLVKQRGDNQPLHYLLGEKEFMSLTFKVSPAVLIPRWDTEILVEEAIKIMQGKKNPRILDLGTGSGAIALSLAYYLSSAEVVAIDISQEALEIAQENAVNLGVKPRVRFLRGNLFAPLARGEKFDLIVSNPPYISLEEMSNLPLDVQKEPVLALAGGQDGLDYYRKIAAGVKDFLAQEGHLLLEIGWQQGAAVREILQQKGFSPVQIIRDLENRDRVVVTRNS